MEDHTLASVYVGTLRVDTFRRSALVAAALESVANNATCHVLVTINAQFVTLAETHRAFREIVNRAEYTCADGQAVCWAARWLHHRKLQRIAGIDLVKELTREAGHLGLRVFLLGGKAGAATATAQLLGTECPGLIIAGAMCPDRGFEQDEEQRRSVLDAIELAQPDILLAALGAPKQELFIHEYLRPLQIPLCIGVGCTFDVLSGLTRRAPQWMQRVGLEWFFRLLSEPKRLGHRYCVGNFLFLRAVWKSRKASARMS